MEKVQKQMMVAVMRGILSVWATIKYQIILGYSNGGKGRKKKMMGHWWSTLKKTH